VGACSKNKNRNRMICNEDIQNQDIYAEISGYKRIIDSNINELISERWSGDTFDIFIHNYSSLIDRITQYN
jgi:hypothetical protein